MTQSPNEPDQNEPDQNEGMADAKAKMREALERKSEREHPTARGHRNTGAVHGSEVDGPGGRRVFRRKSV
ncbi:DUF5302 domain-containing protein [Ruania halotolerans]|uniref:DUF5302 domain-containing protein n=1 Tax=Ruania halotolerans TaxID=2897773 RepID=UPI001E4966A5|nr:DUF5302 domain-containing protein [Ruania halotolerans]UFU05143.1 DUF5302 domain-containing protein [Ruania halotolerans]